MLQKRELEKVLKLFPEQKSQIHEKAYTRLAEDSLIEVLKYDTLFAKTSTEFISDVIRKFKVKIIKGNKK